MTTTLAEHIRDEENAIMRNFQMLALLENNGRMKMNCGGRGFDWPVRYKRRPVEGNTGETPRNFARVPTEKLAALGYRGYQSTDSIYEREKLENRGPEAIIQTFENMVSRITEDIRQTLATEPYIDGEASGNTTCWHGLESMFGSNGTVNISTGAQRAANAGDKVGYPTDTYADLITTLGQYGGENESGAVWPDGVATPEYDFWSPLIVCYNSTAFNGAADTFAAQGDEAMRYAIINAQRNSSLDGQVTNIILARNLYNDLLNLFDNKEQIQVTSENGLRALGFKNVVVFDGVEVSWETGVPTGVGYGINYNHIELRSMYGNLFESEGPEYDMHTQAYNSVVKTLSNFKFKSPRNFFKLISITT
jgi:hypothetical protein